MAACHQILNHRRGSAVVKLQVAYVHRVVVEARNQVAGLEARGLNGGFGALMIEDHGKNNLHQCLFLVVSTGSGNHQPGSAVGMRHQGRAQRYTRTFPASQFIGRTLNQKKTLGAFSERNSRIAGDYRRQPGA